jgi:hypothetical protein
MSHFLNVPTNENGIIADLNLDVDVQTASQPPFAFTDVFIYSHGWWTSDNDASADYNRFSIGFAKTLQTLGKQDPPTLAKLGQGFSGLAAAFYWPSVLSENPGSLLNLLEATSFFTMQGRADAVGANGGYALLRLLIEARHGQPPLRFHLIGHSFGCRVVLSALQKLASDAATVALARAEQASFRVVLIQAAADEDCLSASGKYPGVLTGLPDLRLLLTKSHNDVALGTWYPRAQDLAHFFTNAVPALGAAGPTGNLPVVVNDSFTVAPGTGNVHLATGPFAVADLTPLHVAHAAQYQADMGGHMPAGGQHADIFLPEIYELVARFLMN